MKKALSILLLAISLLTLSAAEIRGKVVAITDGDTIKVLDDLDKGVLKIRLNKIDAPEKNRHLVKNQNNIYQIWYLVSK